MTENRINGCLAPGVGAGIDCIQAKARLLEGMELSKVLLQLWLPDYTFAKIHQTTLKVGEFYGMYTIPQ